MSFHVRGELRISPPLNWAEIKKSSFRPSAEALSDIVLNVEQDERQTDEGITTVFTCVRVLPFTEEPFAADSLREQVEELAREVAGHRVTGQLTLYSWEEPGDIRRVVAEEGGLVRQEKAVFSWPDGSEVARLW